MQTVRFDSRMGSLWIRYKMNDIIMPNNRPKRGPPIDI